MEIRNILASEIKKALNAIELSVEEKQIILDHPAEVKFGDYSTNIALALAKSSGQNPKALAEKIVAQMSLIENEFIDRTEVAGPGFINFYLSKKYFLDSLKDILDRGESFGRLNLGQGRKVVMEYSSPNIAKPFSIGHLRSTIIGDALANIMSFAGYDVIRDNHLGDWGTQFGKQITAIKHWGNEDVIDASADPIKELVALYVQFHEEAEKDDSLIEEARGWFAKLEQGDEEARRLWQKCINWSIVSFERIYKTLGVRFDTMLGESKYIDQAPKVYKALEDKKLTKESEGAEVVFFDNDKLPPFIVRKTDGTSIYATRDLGADLFRKEKYGDNVVIINEVGTEQTLYMQQLYETERMLGWFGPGQRVHVGHGLYSFKDGKMSTRKGNVIWLDDVIAEAVKRAAEFNPDVAETVAIGSLKYNDLKRETEKNIIFDWDEVLNLKGNSGPYLQYAHARIASVRDKALAEGIKAGVVEVADEPTLVEKMLYRFPEVVERSCVEYAPHHICTYLYDLAGAFSSYYVDHQIVNKENLTTSSYRLALAVAVGQVLKNGLNLLGIIAPEKM